jgi:hypothetical protein
MRGGVGWAPRIAAEIQNYLQIFVRCAVPTRSNLRVGKIAGKFRASLPVKAGDFAHPTNYSFAEASAVLCALPQLGASVPSPQRRGR